MDTLTGSEKPRWYTAIAALIVDSIVAAWGSLVIELSKVGIIASALAPFVAATMLRLPLAPPKPPANIRYVVPTVPVKRTLARLPVHIGPLSSPQPPLTAARAPQLPV